MPKSFELKFYNFIKKIIITNIFLKNLKQTSMVSVTFFTFFYSILFCKFEKWTF